MRGVVPLAPPASQASLAVAASCACSVLLVGAGLSAQRWAAAGDGSVTLFAAAVDPDPGRRADAVARLVAELGRDGRLAVHHLSPVEVGQAIGPGIRPPSLPLPELLSVKVPSPGMAADLADDLRRRPRLVVQLETPVLPLPFARPAGIVTVVLALLAAGWAGHREVRRQSAFLLLVRRLGASSGRLLGEALAPVLLSGGTGVVAGTGLLSALPMTGAVASGTALVVLPLAILLAALLGALGSLRRLLAGQP